MPKFIMPDLTEASYGELLQRFLNAVRSIVREKQVDDAKRLSSLFRKNGSADEILGMHLMTSRDRSLGCLRPWAITWVRRRVCHHKYAGKFSNLYWEENCPVHSAGYTDEWGEPNSPKRYGKLVRCLQSFIENNQIKPNMKLALKHWSEDLEWIEQCYAHSGEEN
jgi:hypothetical protein